MPYPSNCVRSIPCCCLRWCYIPKPYLPTEQLQEYIKSENHIHFPISISQDLSPHLGNFQALSRSPHIDARSSPQSDVSGFLYYPPGSRNSSDKKSPHPNTEQPLDRSLLESRIVVSHDTHHFLPLQYSLHAWKADSIYQLLLSFCQHLRVVLYSD